MGINGEFREKRKKEKRFLVLFNLIYYFDVCLIFVQLLIYSLCEFSFYSKLN